MADLRTLLNQRSIDTDTMFTAGAPAVFTPWRNAGQSFCWKSPGTGSAIIEIWGAGGGGGGGQCCGSGIPGNSGAYSRAVVSVNGSGYVCGVTSGTLASASCNGCRGGCTHVAVAPTGTITRCLVAQGGFGGFWMCNASNAIYCCFLASGRCGTLTGTGCGFICNIGVVTTGQGTVVAACACGGDINIAGGISCTEWCACAGDTPVAGRHYHSFPAGFITNRPGHALACYCQTGSSYTRGEAAFELAYRAVAGNATPSTFFLACCGSFIDCGCFPYNCGGGGVVGAGYGSNVTSAGITNTNCGSRGGPGMVKVTFIN
jgi:hypothetical protein